MAWVGQNSDAEASRERSCLSCPAIAGKGDHPKGGGRGAGIEGSETMQGEMANDVFTSLQW